MSTSTRRLTQIRAHITGAMEKGPEFLAEEILLRDITPLPAERVTFFSQLGYFFLVWIVKITVALQLAYLRAFFPTQAAHPTLVKNYFCRPYLEVRLFIPQHIASVTVPLYLTIHGGAFATCDAAIDDEFCKSWCNRTGMIVASLNYRKAPRYHFPTPVLDVAAIARAVIDDEELPVDKSRVIIAGFSAGGNLALTACQLPELQGRILAAVSFFPIVDWSHNPEVKWSQRLYTEKPTEPLKTAASVLDWAYVPAGQDRKAKLLSPCYAERAELPKWVCMIGAQHDMLCREARDMISSLAQKSLSDSRWEDGWEIGTYKWMLVMGVRHGFTDTFRNRRRKDRGAEARRKICEETYASIHTWLQEKVLV